MKEKIVNTKERVAYSLANLGNIPVQTVISSYLLIFYTNIVGLDPAACATLFLIARILDGLNDPLVGFVIDHLPRSKHGKFRPALAIGSILCALNFLLLWFGPLMATSGKLVIAYISYLLIGVLFPVMDISLNSLLPVMTDNMQERNTLSSLKGFTYMLGSVVLGMAAPIILGNTSNRNGYVSLIWCSFAVILIFSLIGAVGVKEHIEIKQEKTESYKFKDLLRILSIRPVWSTFICRLLFTVGSLLLNAVNAYFYTYVLGNLALLSVVSMVQLAGVLPATLMINFFVKRMGKKNLYILGLFLNGVVPILRLINVTNVPLLVLGTLIGGFGSGLCMGLSYAMQADITDTVELETGYRAEAAISSLSSFVAKCAMGIGGAIPGYLLAATGFDAASQVQNDGVRITIIVCGIVLPAVFSAVAMLLFKVFYPLTIQKEKEQVEAIMARRNA